MLHDQAATTTITIVALHLLEVTLRVATVTAHLRLAVATTMIPMGAWVHPLAVRPWMTTRPHAVPTPTSATHHGAVTVGERHHRTRKTHI